ncbi:MAG TPA: DUF1003 domain-containing protein [Gemmatimonadaceae bacterium]|nr:DUF1003 domain-containing protein [Gemmatimonadaceae bacterium]
MQDTSTNERGVRITGAAFGVVVSAHPVLGTLLANLMGVTTAKFTAATTSTAGEIDLSNDRRAQSPSRRVGTTRARVSLAAQHAAQRSLIEVIAARLTRIAASTPFLVLHVLWFVAWMTINMGYVGITPFDPFPFGLLTMVVSLEAIFLSIFVLMAQSRESAVEELREEVSLQVVLRMEEEVTKTLQLVAGLYARLGHTVGVDDELREMLGPLDPDKIEKELIAQIQDARRPGRWRGK